MKRDDSIKIMISREERKDFEKLAESRRKTLSELVRELLNREVMNEKKVEAA